MTTIGILAIELGSRGITANTVMAGPIAAGFLDTDGDLAKGAPPGAMQALAAAADKAKSLKVDDLSRALKSMTVDTVLGPLSWDKKGDVVNPKYVFYVWKDGKYSEM